MYVSVGVRECVWVCMCVCGVGVYVCVVWVCGRVGVCGGRLSANLLSVSVCMSACES